MLSRVLPQSFKNELAIEISFDFELTGSLEGDFALSVAFTLKKLKATSLKFALNSEL